MSEPESTRSELQKRAQSALLQYAFLRWESAVVIAGTILLTVFVRRPFPGWPVWGWPFLGIIGLAAIVYSSLTDEEANARILLRLFQEQFDPRRIKDKKLRQDVETALEYQRRIEALARAQKPGVMRDRLEDTANQLTDWIRNIYRLALRLDAYRQDKLLARQREEVPQEIQDLTARLKLESDPDLRGQLEQILESKGAQWQALRSLDSQMKQAQLHVEQSLAALATVYSQMQLINAQDIQSGRAERLRADIQEQVNRLNDLIASINEVYDYQTQGLG